MTLALASARNAALAGVAWPGAGLARAGVLILAGSALLTLSAKVQVPFWPVPMTLQTFAVLVIGATYGARLGAATVIAYLAEGIAGLPVFAGVSAGPAYVAGPTAGYLVGFVIAAALVGALAQRGWDRNLPRLVIAMTLGHVALFITGVAWLAHLFGWEKAVAAGVAPFVLATLLKTALAVAAMRGFWILLGSHGRDVV